MAEITITLNDGSENATITLPDEIAQTLKSIADTETVRVPPSPEDRQSGKRSEGQKKYSSAINVIASDIQNVLLPQWMRKGSSSEVQKLEQQLSEARKQTAGARKTAMQAIKAEGAAAPLKIERPQAKPPEGVKASPPIKAQPVQPSAQPGAKK